ncbi:hypothetical protein N656DRAFT_561562 [Canariomyces notabilis]|uniref:Xylanolytic transcriptional activator regulatory domain-containing protein n=1 Tax=Canariomyces notabilis TaxID=2074819 RepID=A0AAN6QBB9_9PEZI|nr:hypothetical protein N656DRAFT_561562 [Canariomyces arenarius]
MEASNASILDRDGSNLTPAWEHREDGSVWHNKVDLEDAAYYHYNGSLPTLAGLSTGDEHILRVSLGTPSALDTPFPLLTCVSNIQQPEISRSQLRYPVLEPLVPYLTGSIDLTLAYDLLERYFESRPLTPLYPLSPYVLCFLYRRRSFLNGSRPRQCKAVLLSSMLWAAAEISESSLLAGHQHARRQVCDRLKLLTLALAQIDVPAGNVDDVVACISLATVGSALEHEGSTWSNAACSLARELQLGCELPADALSIHQSDKDSSMAEEEREIRRRVWWLLYIVDRHLALHENRPPVLSDGECSGLLQPMNDMDYQEGNFQARLQIYGSPFQCTSPSLYGFFLPLMAILGEVLDHRRPTLSVAEKVASYERSLECLKQQCKELRGPAAVAQNRLAAAYGTYMVYVLRILLTREHWEVNLVDNSDRGLSLAFFDAATHTLSAAKAVSDILKWDPGLELMPFFFSIFLFWGSFPLLVFASRPQFQQLPGLDQLYAVALRAHEACIVTLDTQYQRDFCRTLRSVVQLRVYSLSC